MDETEDDESYTLADENDTETEAETEAETAQPTTEILPGATPTDNILTPFRKSFLPISFLASKVCIETVSPAPKTDNSRKFKTTGFVCTVVFKFLPRPRIFGMRLMKSRISGRFL